MYPYNKDQKLPTMISPLMCWDTTATFYHCERRSILDIRYLEQFMSNKKCSLPDSLPDCLRNYDCIIITAPNKVISWVSEGFPAMTGYNKAEVINKTPAILQGPDTNETTKQLINEQLSKQSQVKAVIINYKKYGVAYHCRVHIEPVFNQQNELTNFIAFEKEV
jgi:PAS domain S-box-containing protein